MVFFPALIFLLFLLKYSDTHLCSLRLINKNDVLKKIKLPKLLIFGKS